MIAIRVFDPAMCCSTGICGPSVDPQIVRFAADLDWLKSQGASVERFNLSQQPAAFVADAAVKLALEEKGEAGLPLIKVNDQVKSSGIYPTRAELASWAGVTTPGATVFSDVVCELVAIGAAVAANSESSFKFHYDRARKLGVSVDDMQRAVATAQAIKDIPAKSMRTTTERYLHHPVATAAVLPASASAGMATASKTAKSTLPIASADACCGPDDSATSTSKTGCC